MESFQYPSLDHLRKEIRLLRPLLRHLPDPPPIDEIASSSPGVTIVPDLSLEFELQVVSIHDKPVYTALSYVWGDSKDLKPITVNGSSFLVTNHLNDALRHIRFEDIAPAIWIDSICIDQTNDIEKNEQIQFMGSIYSNALHVLVWLGPPTENSHLMADVLHEFGKNVRRRFNVPSPQKYDLVDYMEFNSESELCEVVETAIKSVQSQDLQFTTPIDFMRNFTTYICGVRWWYRVWVLQEFVLAQKVQFQVGLRKIELEELAAFLLLTMLLKMNSVWEIPLGSRQDLFKNQSGIDWILHMLVHRERRHQKRNSRDDSKVFEMLCATYCRPAWRGSDGHLLKATNKMDQIYGLVGLFEDDYKTLGLTIDIRKKWQDVYGDVAQQLIQAGYLDIFALCQAKGSPNGADMPSWAPIWHQAIHHPNGWFKTSPGNSRTILGNSLFSASSTSKVQTKFMTASDMEGLPTRFMRISGVFVDEVIEVGSTYLRSNATTSFHRQLLYGTFFREIQYLCKQSEKLGFHTYTAASLRDAAWRMPVWDHEFPGVNNDGDVQRATILTLNRYRSCLPLFKGVEAHMRAEQMTSQLPKSTTFFSPLRFFRVCFYRATSRLFFFLFRQAQYTGTRFQRLYSWLKLVLTLFSTVQDPIGELGSGMMQEANCYLLHMEGGRPMRPFITKTRYIGLGPGSLQSNDTVCICFGARVPHVLRRLHDGRSGYVFIGEAFVYGLMDGEFMKEESEKREFDVF